jgi:hypothetical protein
MGLSGQLHAPHSLPLKTHREVPTDYDARWSPETVSTFYLPGIERRFVGSPDHSLFTIVNELSRILVLDNYIKFYGLRVFVDRLFNHYLIFTWKELSGSNLKRECLKDDRTQSIVQKVLLTLHCLNNTRN